MAKKNTSNKELDKRVIQIAEKLESIRKQKGYTSYENFAIDHDISRMLYWRLEKGTNFTINSFLRIIDAQGISLGEFFKDFE